MKTGRVAGASMKTGQVTGASMNRGQVTRVMDKKRGLCYAWGMVDRVLIDTLNFKAVQLAERWVRQIRKAEQLKHYNVLSDETLRQLNESVFPQLARFLEHGLDRKLLGEYGVAMGKAGVKHGFPLSEVVYGLRLSQQVVLEYIESEFVLDNPVALYQTLSLVPKVADFFVLSCFYINKGFQEATVENLSAVENIPKDLLIKYFKDDFFYKKE
jgi:hypothetical protein